MSVVRGRWLVRGIAVVAVLAFVGTVGQYQARRFLFGDVRTVCIVTEASLTYDRAQPSELGSMYTGDDHPADPGVGDEYVGHSGCLPGEEECTEYVEMFGTRRECNPLIGSDPQS